MGPVSLLRACAWVDLGVLKVLLPYLADVQVEEVFRTGETASGSRLGNGT
jgi:hypothetical protein